MTDIDTDTPWEPPIAGTEVEQLVGALERLRTTFRWKTDGLDAAGLGASFGASSLTLGALLKHLAAQEDYAFTTKRTGKALGPPWDAWGWDGSDDGWARTRRPAGTPEPAAQRPGAPYTVTTQAPPRPRLWARASRAPST